MTTTVSTFLLLAFIFHTTNAAVFTIRNNCRYTVWAGAVPGGGRQLTPGQTWSLSVAPGTTGGRIWPRTNCNFDGSGRGRCQTGDCNGLLQCQNYGTPPNTLAEYALNQYQNLDFFDISLVDGFNVPLSFRPNSGGCTRGISCTADINGQCPSQLRAPGGFFKTRCPDAYSYPKDDPTSTFTCPGGTNYNVEEQKNRSWIKIVLLLVLKDPIVLSTNVHITTDLASLLHTHKTRMTVSTISTFLLLAILSCSTNAAVFTILNNCPYTIWVGAVPGGGQQLNSGQTWALSVPSGTSGRIWPRTNCVFDGSGRGKCQTGDCNGLLRCQNYGTPPNTLAEYALNQVNNVDFFDMSLVDGFNAPLEFKPSSSSSGCTRGI
ncbi:hypothetical protein M8C21_016745, partial [Ambrosia artemisiifolia]